MSENDQSVPEPRRQTPSERSHEALLAALTKAAPAATRPSFRIAQVKGVGGATVVEWDAHVPVCDEYPTAGEAFAAALDFARQLGAEYTSADTPADAGKTAKTAGPEGEPPGEHKAAAGRAARQAAAIAARSVGS